MKRRITSAILATVWAVLLMGGVGVYVTTRAILVTDLDATLLARAAALPELAGTEAAAQGERYVVLNELGQTVARAPPGPAAGARWQVAEARFARLADGVRVRSLTIRVRQPDDTDATPVTVIYSGSAQTVDRVLGRLIAWLVVLGVLAGAAAAALASRAASAALRPLESAARTVGTIDERHLDRRIGVSDLPPELGPVAERLNEMLARLEGAFERQQRFLADASHELRTPVAALLTTLEVSLRRPRDAEALTKYLRACLADARLLRELTQTLLARVRADHGQDGTPEPPEAVDLAALLESCALVADGLALDRDVTICRDLPPPGTRALVRAAEVRTIAVNLLANGVAYNRPGGEVTLTCAADGGWLTLCVRDTGIGIARDDLPRIFEPFYRVDAARAREGGHLGLGLPLVRSAVERLGGEVDVTSEIGRGTAVRVRLPVSPVSPVGAGVEDASPASARHSSSSHRTIGTLARDGKRRPMNPNPGSFRRILMAFAAGVCLLTLCVVAPAFARPRSGPPVPVELLGAYRLVAGGHFTGTGNGVISPRMVILTAQLRSAQGQTYALTATNLPIENGRFSGPGRLGDLDVTVQGRIDPADGEVIKRPRISCTFRTSDGKYGRLAGERRGGP